MKNNCVAGLLSLINWYKNTYTLKVLLVFFLSTIVNINSSAFSQSFNFSVQDKTIKEVLRIIENQSDYRFFFSDNFQDLGKKTSLSIENKQIDEVLSSLLTNSKITYQSLENNVIVITPIGVRQQAITGLVTDARTGSPLPGVYVIVKDTKNGTITDSEGKFAITLASDNNVLVFSFLGYISEEVVASGKTNINVSLVENIEALEEVVIVGYGSQKKVNMTGSVSSISANDINQRPVTNSSNLLQGRMAGVQITQGTGQPGKEETDISVRGFGSYGASSAPLILIDGVVGELSYINPQDIESISVLKDAASAAIYGARAANGVVLVTTKKGKAEPITITYGNNFAMHNATRLPELIYNSAETMEMWNAAAIHSSNSVRFTEEEIEAYREGNKTDPLQYPNYNWMDNTFKTGYAQSHHLNISGGSENVTFNSSFSYTKQDGILPGHGFKRFTTSFNMQAKINDRISIGSNIMLSQRDIREPSFSNDSYVLLIFGMTGLQMPYLPDGSGRYSARAYSKLWQNRNPIAVANEWKKTYKHYDIRPQINLDINLLKGLTWNTKGAINYEPSYESLRTYAIDSYYYQKINETDEDYSYANNQWPNHEGLTQENYHNALYTLFSTLNYEKTFGKNSFNLMGGYSQEYQYYSSLEAYRQKFPSSNLSQIDAGSTDVIDNGGTANEWALQSLFGRVNYSYNEKYLGEANFRYDGTSRIADEFRWGFFPSFSGAWRLSKEDFMKSLGWVDNLKIRVSYGELGNQDIGNYPYQDLLGLTTYSFDESTEQGAYVNALSDKSIKWEVTKMLDGGLDFSLYRGLVFFSIDAYKKVTDDILYEQEIPASIGLSAPTVNYGSMQNVGFDMELGHNYRIGDFKWEIKGIFSAFRNEVTKLVATDYIENDTRINKEGLPWGSFYLYEWIGIFQSDEEIANSPTQLYTPQPGDLKFKDQDGDNDVDADDRIVVDGAFPNYTYSFNARFEWKNFDLSAFFQGVQGRKLYVINWGISPFTQAGAPAVKWRNAWTEENPTNELPALYIEGYEPNTNMRSTFNLQDASYFRVKSINFGYTLPKLISEKIKLDYLRLYVAGDNLFTFTKYEGLDPERSGDNTNFAQYPQTRILSVGLDVKF